MVINLKPERKQWLAYQKLMDTDTRYLVFGGGAGGGKSWLGCEWLILMCYRYPGTKWFIGREELKKLMQSTYLTYLKVCKFHNIPKEDWDLNGQYNYIQFANGSRIDLLDLKFLPTDPMYERLGSLEYTGGWIEEAGEVNFMAFDILKTRIGRQMNKEWNLPPKLLLTCNPNKEWLYHTIYLPDKEGRLPDGYFFIKSLYSDNNHTSKEYGEQLAQVTDKAQRERLMAGNWEYDSDPTTLIAYEAILDLFTNTPEDNNGERYITADIARMGQDMTVIYVWEGLRVIAQFYANKQNLEQTVSKLKEMAMKYHVPYSHIIVDEDGVGGGVVDFMNGIKGFKNNSTPFANKATGLPDNYQNLKTQCYYVLADYINQHKMAVTTEDTVFKHKLIEELQQVRSKDLDKDGKLKIMSKPEVKEKLGRSPDFSDAMMLRMYFELETVEGPATISIYIPTFNKKGKF